MEWLIVEPKGRYMLQKTCLIDPIIVVVFNATTVTIVCWSRTLVFSWVLTPQKIMLCACYKSDFFFLRPTGFQISYHFPVLSFIFCCCCFVSLPVGHLLILIFLWPNSHSSFYAFPFKGSWNDVIPKKKKKHFKLIFIFVTWEWKLSILTSGDIWCYWEIVTFKGVK